MLDEKEKRIVRRYCLLPAASRAFLIMAMLIGAVWILLCMINDLVFYGSFYQPGLYFYLGITVVYVIGFMVCILMLRIGMERARWKKIVEKAGASLSQKDYSAQVSAVLGAKAAGSLLGRSDNAKASQAGDAFNAIAAIGSVATVAEMTSEISRNVKLTATLCEVPIPKAGKYVAAIILLPVVLLVAVYIPHFVVSGQAMDTSKAIASESTYALQAAFQKSCARVYANDPMEGYDTYGYRVSGYLYDTDAREDSYLSVTVGNDGLINEVRYYIDIDIQADKEENLLKVQEDLETLHALLQDAGVDAVADTFLEEYELPEEFITQFREGSYYESIVLRMNEYMTVYYMTDSEEDYDEYSYSYIYISISD